MSQLSELSGECTDCGEYFSDCICSDTDEDFDAPEYQRTCPDCWHKEEFCVCGEVPPEARHEGDCPCENCTERLAKRA